MKKKLLIIGLILSLPSCTLNLTNIATHGTATDLVDDELSTSPKVDANVSLPISPM